MAAPDNGKHFIHFQGLCPDVGKEPVHIQIEGGNMALVGVENIDPLSCLYVQDELSVEDASRIVWEAVASLPQKSREVFEKRNEGMSNAEIAASMNLSVKTVEGHITRSLKTIRVALKKYFFLFLF